MAAVVGPSAAGCGVGGVGVGGGQDLSKSGPKLGGYYCRYGEEGWRMWWWPNATQKVFCSLSPSCSRSLVVLFSGSTAAHSADPLLPGMGFAKA